MSENSLFKTALTKAMQLCSQQELCKDDIKKKMQLWGVGNDDAEKIIEILSRENFISENRYAAAFVRDKFKYNKWGKVKITAHLRAKNINEETIRTALETIDKVQYVEFIKDLLANHRRFIKAKNKYDLKAKLLRYGLSKGLESNILYDLLNDLDD
jgi:regulatory protein